MKRTIFALVCVLTACSTPPAAERRTSAESSPEVVRYIASLDGDLQTGYLADRAVAETKLQEVESKNPTPENSDSYLEYLSLLDTSGKSQDAEKKIKDFLVKNPEEKRAVFLLAAHYWRAKKKELASYFFNQLAKDPKFPWQSLLQNNLGMIALSEGNRTAAIGYFEKATKAAPAVAAPHVNLGALYLQSRSYKEAEAMFRKARALDDGFEDAALGLGVALEGQGKFEEAHGVYAEYMAAHPESSSLAYNDAIILGNRLNQKAEAAQIMLRYIQRGGKETARAQEIISSWR